MAQNIQFKATIDTTDFLSGLNTISDSLKNIEKSLKNTSNKSKSTSKSFSDLGKVLKGLNNPLKNLNNPIDTFIKKFTRIGNMLRTMLLRKALRSVISAVGDGFKGLAKYSSEFNKSMSLLSNSSKQLGYSFSAMVAPLINALAPALNQIIQLCIKAVNAINQLFSAFVGKTTFITAKTQTDDWAESLDKASGSAKKAKATLMGFDEINKLNDENDSGSGSTIDPTKMFETKTPISKTIQDFKDKLIKAWKNADFTEIGGIIGEKLKTALDSIPWENIKGTAGKIGQSIATLINGFVETDGLGTSIGVSLGEAFNTALEFLNKFVTNLNWQSIGTFISDAINGVFATVDFKKAGETLSKAVKGILDTINTTLEKIDWVQVGYKIGEFLNNIDWYGILEKLGRTIGLTVGAVIKLIWGYIKSGWNTELEKAKGNFWLALYNSIVKLAQRLSMGFWMGTLIVPALKGLWDSLKTELSNLWNNKILVSLNKAKSRVTQWFSELKTVVSDGLKPLKDLWNGFVDSINGQHSFLGMKYTISLPRMYATGGFPEDGLFMANHGEMVGKFSNGRTAVANNQQITEGIAQAVYRAMTMANNGNNGSYINNTITIDGEVIARAVTKGQSSLNRRYSPTMA